MVRLFPLLIAAGMAACSAPAKTTSRGVALFFDDVSDAVSLDEEITRSRAMPLCDAPDDVDCLSLTRVSGSPSVVNVRTRGRGGDDAPVRSVGAAFDEAYELREETGARRAEPLLRVETPLGTRGLLDGTHDPRAEEDPLWSLKHIAAEEAWEAIRDKTGRSAGEEAQGVVIAHPDTGYLEHAEIWSADRSASPVWPEKGYDYFDEDERPIDELLDDGPLDNPGHGTGAASTIASPSGCQISDAEKCPTGPALGARLVPLRVGRSVVILDTDHLASAIRDASGTDRSRVSVETHVMSISMGGVASWTLWDAVKRAEERGYIIVAAAGNYVPKVVWPARFPSVVAVAATNVGCRPWEHTSFGPAVDVSAPGESVWRASLAEDGSASAGMSKGTTFAAATVAGVAALWLAYHADEEELAALRESGDVASAFRSLLEASAWRPGTGDSSLPCDEGASWEASRHGAGIVDARALLRLPLESRAVERKLAPLRLEELPLWTSLYPEEESAATVLEDYRRLFGLPESEDTETVAIFETEILHHYAVSDAVSAAIDAVVGGDRSEDAFASVREALRARDLSTRLRAALP